MAAAFGLPEKVHDLARTSRFWIHFFHDARIDSPYRELAPIVNLAFDVARERAITLDLLPQLDPISLGARIGAHRTRLASMARTASTPPTHVIDPEELDLLARAIAASDPMMPHPGYVVLFFHGFCRATKRSDVAYLERLVAAALDAYGLLEPGARARHRTRLERIVSGVAATWRMSQATPPDDRDAPTFPRSTLEEILRAARQTCADAIVLDERTPTVKTLADDYARTKDRDVLAVLHDALIEAGCDTPGVLAALRPDHPLHAEWVIELILS